jgi:hypothetical protein
MRIDPLPASTLGVAKANTFESIAAADEQAFWGVLGCSCFAF